METPDLFEDVSTEEPKKANPLAAKIAELSELAKKRRGRSSSKAELAPAKHQPDFFVADLFDYAFKGDAASMDAPIFSLSTKKDMEIFRWESRDQTRFMEVAPSAFGRATMFDKDVLIFLASQVTAAKNEGRPIVRTIRFTAHDLLITTNRDTSSNGYKGLIDAITRLRGTTIKTNIKTGGKESTRVFGLIDSGTVITSKSGRMSHVEVVLSEWLWNALDAYEVLTLHRDYFRLSKPLERRLYEIARKHVGRQGLFEMRLETLWAKAGSRSPLKKFRFQLRELLEADSLPEYRFSLSVDDKVCIYSRDQAAIAKALTNSRTPRRRQAKVSRNQTE